ncbi:hypothetical protein C4579_03025 [Candidatus Microgenomates bacterium]|nr:MAG: hypothetical protein C4579_03025 [Candidatus Microgenomates bacterium]
MTKAVLLLRIIHTLFAVYFILCIGYIYYAAITATIDLFLGIAIFSLCLEGFLVFVLNKGHCPLAPLQAKLNDPVPFFNLFLPDRLAKKAIPFFTVVMVLGLLFLVLRVFFR